MTEGVKAIPVKGAKKVPKTQELTKELKEVKKVAKKEITEVKQAIEVEKKGLKKEAVDAKKKVKTLQVENNELKQLIIDVIKKQDKTRWTEFLNIVCWILCFALILFQSIKGV